MVASELGIGTFQRRVSVCLGLLDTASHARQLDLPKSLVSYPYDRRNIDIVVGVFRLEIGENIPIPVRLLRLVVLGRVLGFYKI